MGTLLLPGISPAPAPSHTRWLQREGRLSHGSDRVLTCRSHGLSYLGRPRCGRCGMLAVCLLGPVNASIDEVPLRITRPLERALLARLALSPGVAVDAPHLLDELWTAPPERGLATL